jgi:uncharacterized membrane protein YdjX (TVP38/TMEM64 family)
MLNPQSGADHNGISGMNEGTTGASAQRGGSAPIRILLVALFAAGIGAFFYFDLGQYLSLEALKTHREALVAWVGRNGALAWLVYLLVYAAVTLFSLPGGALMTIVGGFVFGPALGTGLTVIGATLGAVGLFLAARYVFHDYLLARAGPALKRMEAGFNEDAMSYMLFLRLVPAFPFVLVNLVPAFLGVKLGVYAVSTFLGIIPGTLVYALVGDGLGAVLDAGGDLNLGIIFEPRFLAPILGLSLLSLIPVAYKKFKRRAS